MGRISRKHLPPEHKDGNSDIYQAGLYLRLSVEDNGKDNSDSLENQQAILINYISQRPYLTLAGIYSDNGYTGTNFERPEFNRLLDDVRKGKINCIIVKDLSRLGRNYIEAGDYLEKIFPFLKVRFISVNDNYDSNCLGSNNELSASLKNVVNDMYAKDISRKVGSAMKAKRVRGDYMGSYAPYGYLKDPENKNHLIIDTETADIVIKIFEMRANGYGISSIARKLNEKGISSPGRLRFERGIITNNNKKGKDLLWNRHILNDLLRNAVYIGNLEQGRSSSCLYKGIKFHLTKKSEWDIAENTHEPIISRELWEQVQSINSRKAVSAKETSGKYSHLKKRKNPYGSLLICADCGRVIKQVTSYNKNGTKAYFNYKCPQNIELGNTVCPKKSIKAVDLDNAVMLTIKHQMRLFINTSIVLQKIIEKESNSCKNDDMNVKIKKIEAQIAEKKKIFASLYTDLKDGILNQDEYVYAKQTYQSDITQLEKELDELKNTSGGTTKADIDEMHWKRLISKYYKAKEITSDLLNAIVDSITLYADNSISIKFKYMNEFKLLQDEYNRLKEEAA